MKKLINNPKECRHRKLKSICTHPDTVFRYTKWNDCANDDKFPGYCPLQDGQPIPYSKNELLEIDETKAIEKEKYPSDYKLDISGEHYTTNSQLKKSDSSIPWVCPSCDESDREYCMNICPINNLKKE